MPRLTSGPAIAAVTLGLVIAGAAGWAIAGGPTPPTVGEMFDQAYCQGWDRRLFGDGQRADTLRALFPDDELWAKVRAAMVDASECPRSKPRIAGKKEPS